MAVYETREVRRLALLAELQREDREQGRRAKGLHVDDAAARRRAREEHRRHTAAQQRTALDAARTASISANLTCLKCLLVSLCLIGVALWLNSVNPCAIFVDCTVGVMMFVVVSWAIVFTNHTIRIAAIQLR